jgi:predicted acyl esterase
LNSFFFAIQPQNQTSNDLRSDNIYFDSAPFSYSISMLGENVIIVYFIHIDVSRKGSIHVQLSVHTNRTDTDFVVRVSDVYPDGTTSMLLGDDVVRMRWRHNASVETPTTPGQEYVISL